MLTTRDVEDEGFGHKNRDWNRTDLLERWREHWAEHANGRLAELDIDARVYHRSLEPQGIELDRSIGAQLAMEHGIDLGMGRGLGR